MEHAPGHGADFGGRQCLDCRRCLCRSGRDHWRTQRSRGSLCRDEGSSSADGLRRSPVPAPQGTAAAAMTERTHAARLWRLDAVRGAAAVYVAAGHITRHQFPPGGWLNRSLAFGQEAVIVFFLLSGFVIHWSMQTRPAQSFGSYLRQRALRIYPLFILTLLVAALIGWAKETHDHRLGWPTFVGNLLMLQDFALAKPNTWVDVYGGVSTLWSLSYEWWFYLLYFPICRRIPAPWQSRWVAAISLSQLAVYLIWPNFASRVLIYFSIWWVGVELARWYFAPSEISRRTAVTAIATVALAA